MHAALGCSYLTMVLGVATPINAASRRNGYGRSGRAHLDLSGLHPGLHHSVAGGGGGRQQLVPRARPLAVDQHQHRVAPHACA